MPGTSYYKSNNEKEDKKILKRSRNKERIIHQWMRCSTMRNMMREIIRSDDERHCFCFGLILLQNEDICFLHKSIFSLLMLYCGQAKSHFHYFSSLALNKLGSQVLWRKEWAEAGIDPMTSGWRSQHADQRLPHWLWRHVATKMFWTSVEIGLAAQQ